MSLGLPAKSWHGSPHGTPGIECLSGLLSPGNDAGSCLGMGGGTGFQPCAVAVGEEFVPFESLLRPNVVIRLENCFIRLVTCYQKWM